MTPHTVKDVCAFLRLASYYRRYIPNFASVATRLTGLTKKDAKLIWDDDCEHAFLAFKKALVQPPVLAYPTRDGHFVFSTDASDTGMGAVLEQEQEEGGRDVKRVIVYASETLNASQRRYCTRDKELLAVVTAVELFTYYVPKGVVACWITHLQPFDFKIIHRPGKHHSHDDGLSRRTSRSCKRDTCPECAPLLHQVTTEEDTTVRVVTPQEQYVEHFDGYIELMEDDSTLLRDPSAPVLSPSIAPELGHHLNGKDEPNSVVDQKSEPDTPTLAVFRAKLIEQLLGVDSLQACTQTEPEDCPISLQETDNEKTSVDAEIEESLPFPEGLAEFKYRLRATEETRQASPALQALIDLSDVEIAQEQEQDPNLRLIMDMIQNRSERPSWEHVQAEIAEIKALRS